MISDVSELAAADPQVAAGIVRSQAKAVDGQPIRSEPCERVRGYMKVFISWSGTRSRGVAEALSSFLTRVIQSIDPFISTAMDAGVKWNEVVAKNLDENGIGILCVTPGNVDKPWLNFEAGALSRHLDESARVIPYLLDFGTPGNLTPPLNQFNAVTADQGGTFKLVETLNKLDTKPQASDALKETFDAFWTSFAKKLDQIRKSSPQPPARRSDTEKLDELLSIGHQLLRTRILDEDTLNSWKSPFRPIYQQRRRSSGNEVDSEWKLKLNDALRSPLERKILEATLLGADTEAIARLLDVPAREVTRVQTKILHLSRDIQTALTESPDGPADGVSAEIS